MSAQEALDPVGSQAGGDQALEDRQTAAGSGGALALAGEDTWSARRRQKGIHYRSFDVTTPEGSFVVEYRARGMGNESIVVDGAIVAQARSTWWFTPHFRFCIGSAEALLAARFWPWLTLRWMELMVDGRVLYSEGPVPEDMTADQLAGAISDALLSDGIQVVGDQPIGTPVPRNITCAKHADGVRLTQRWFSWLAMIILPVVAVLDVAVVLVYVVLPTQEAPWQAHALLLPGILAALALTYYATAQLANRTVVQVAPGVLSIRHGPLPWPGNRTIPISNVKQFHCRETLSRNYEGDNWVTYTLAAVLEDGREVVLLRRIGSPDASHFLEREVQSSLGI